MYIINKSMSFKGNWEVLQCLGAIDPKYQAKAAENKAVLKEAMPYKPGLLTKSCVSLKNFALKIKSHK